MSQGYDKLYPPDAKPAAAWGGYAAAARTNQSAVNTGHAGASAPATPEDRQRWLDTSVTPNVEKIYDAASATWKTLDFIDITTKEVKDARGTASTLDARLDQALNEDGTLKASTTLNPDEFKAVTGTPTRTANNIFTKSGDQTAIYTAKRRVKMTPGPNYSRVTSSSFAADTTTVTIDGTNVPVGITAADVGLIDPTAATTGVDAQSLASPTGGYIEDYIATDIKRARRGLAALFHDFDEDPATTTGLTWGHKSGILRDGTVKAAGTLALTDAATNYVELDPSAGTLSKNTTGFTATSVPIRKVVTAGGAQTSSVDSRPWLSLPGIVPVPQPNFNFTFNGDVEIWGAGTAAAPTGWALTGAGASVAKNTTAGQFKLGAASAAITRAGTDCYLSQSPDTFAGFGPVGWWQGKVVTFGCWVRATVASRARLTIADGVGTTSSAYHTGGSALEFLTVTRTLDAAATKVELRCGVDTGDTTAQFDGAVLVVGSAVSDFIPSGWRGRKCVLGLATGSDSIAQGTTSYYSLFTSTTEANTQQPIPFKGVARRMYSHASETVVGGQTFAYTLRKSGVDTALTSMTSSGRDSNDTTNEVAFAAADTIAVKGVVSATAGGSRHQTFLEYEETP